jgi:Transmembrane secretion effector
MWMVAVAVVLAVMTIAGEMSPALLLILTFALSAGDAFETPSWRPVLPELVQKEDLPAGAALNGIEFNFARVTAAILKSWERAGHGPDSGWTILPGHRSARVFRDGTDLKLRPQAVRVLRVLLQRAAQSVHYDQLPRATIVPYFTAWAYPRGGVGLVLGSFCGLLLFQALAVFLFGVRTENRPLEELAPEGAPLGMTGAKAVKA